jgi:hypothetical protein
MLECDKIDTKKTKINCLQLQVLELSADSIEYRLHDFKQQFACLIEWNLQLEDVTRANYKPPLLTGFHRWSNNTLIEMALSQVQLELNPSLAKGLPPCRTSALH